MLRLGSNTKVTETLIESYIYPKTLSRNARIALLKFLSFNASQDADVQDKLLSACHHYFLDYSDKAICFFDLQPYISCLERGTQEELLRRVPREIDEAKPHEGELMVRKSGL